MRAILVIGKWRQEMYTMQIAMLHGLLLPSEHAEDLLQGFQRQQVSWTSYDW